MCAYIILNMIIPRIINYGQKFLKKFVKKYLHFLYTSCIINLAVTLIA